MRKLILTISFLITWTSSYSDNEPLWKDLGGWVVRVDTSLGNGCFTYQLYEGNTIFRIGFNKINGGMYFFIGDSDWQSLEEGKNYPIQLYFGNKEPWGGDATAIRFGEIPVLWLDLRSSDSASEFLKEFMNELSLNVLFQGESIVLLSLKGTFKAGQELLECQKAINDIPNSNSEDPFRDQRKKSDDPFRNI